METTLGQLLGRGMLSIWHVCPMLKGVGYCSLILLFWMNAYYIVVISWSVYYFVNSLRFTLPWAACDHAWNTAACRSDSDLDILCNDYFLHPNASSRPLWATPIDGANVTVASVIEAIEKQFRDAHKPLRDISYDRLDTCIKVIGGDNFSNPVREYWE